MNNKIFKKKSSFYLFGALALLLILACVGGFFIFNASAAKVKQNNVKITNNSSGTPGITIQYKKEADSDDSYVNFVENAIFDKGTELDFALSISDGYTGNVGDFEITVDSSAIYTNEDEKKSNVDCTVTKLGGGKFKVTLPTWAKPADSTDDNYGNNHYYALVKLSFTNDSIKELKNLKFNSISSNYDWIDISNQFEIYSKVKDGVKIDNGINFKVAQGSETFPFYIEMKGVFKECLDSIAFTATHTQTTNKETGETKDYYYEITGLNNNDSDKKVFVDEDGNEYENNYNVEVFSYTDSGVKHRLRCYTENNIVPAKLVDENNTSYDYNSNYGTFGDSGIKYDSINRTLVDVNSTREFKIEGHIVYINPADNSEFFYENQKLVSFDVKSSDGKSSIDCKYRKIALKLFSLNDKGIKVTEGGIQSDLNVNLNISNVSGHVNRKVTVNKVIDTDENTVNLNDDRNVDVKIAVPTKKDENPSWNSNLKLEQQSDGTYKIVDTSNSETISVDYDENTTSFIGKDNVKYTFDKDNKKFKDDGGNWYGYNETTKSFVGKNGVNYTYNSETKKFSYEGNYLNVAVPYDKGSVYLFINPTNSGWYKGSDVKITSGNDQIENRVEEKALNKFVDSDGTEYKYDTVNKNFAGKNGVTYKLSTVFRYTDGETEYTCDYDEEKKTFTGKDGIVYTYDEDKKEFKYRSGFKEYTSNDYDGTSFTGKDDVKYTRGMVFKSSDGNTVYDYDGRNITDNGAVEYRMLFYYEIKNIKDDETAVNVTGFKLENLNFNVTFGGAPAGTSDRVTISVNKIIKQGGKEVEEEIKSSNNKYSGITPYGFTCKIVAGNSNNNVDWQDVDLDKLECSFSGEITPEVSGPDNINNNEVPYKKFTIKGIKNDVTLNITSVPYKTIGVCFHEPKFDANGNFTGISEKEIDDKDNPKADIYLSNSSVKISSFSSGQSWNFDLKFKNEYEAQNDTLEAFVYPLDKKEEADYDENTKSFTGKDGIVYTYDENNKKFKCTYNGTDYEYSYDESTKSFTGYGGIKYFYDEANKKFAIYEVNGSAIENKNITQVGNIENRTYSFSVPEGIRNCEKVVIVVKNIVERRMQIQFKVKEDYVSPGSDGKYNLKDFKIKYIKPDSYKRDENGMYVPKVEVKNGIYEYNDSCWSTLDDSGWTKNDNGDILSAVNKIIPYNGILVFRITLDNDDSKVKYILDDKIEIAANSIVEKTVIDPANPSKKEDVCSCIQVVVGRGDGIKEAMIGRTGSVSIGDLESSVKEVTFKFFGKQDENGNASELDPGTTHGGNILEKVTAYRINEDAFSRLTEDKLYSTKILYQCMRNDSGTVENTRNSYMLNYKKSGNVIALRTLAGIDVNSVTCTINGKLIENNNRNINNMDDDNNGSIVAFRIPDDYVNAYSPENLTIEIGGIDIKKYKITLDGFHEVGVERKLSSETDFKKVDSNPFEVDYGEDFEIKIIGSSKDSYEGLFNRISLGSGSTLFLKEGTQTGATALEKTSDGGFTYIFFVYKVKSDSTIKFTNEINNTMLDFDNIDGMEFYECSGSKDENNLAVLENKKIQGKISCAYGTKYSFAVGASTGYDLNSFNLSATVEGSETIQEGSTEFSNMFSVDTTTNPNYKIYTIINRNTVDNTTVESGVQKSMMMSGFIKKEMKTVTFKMPVIKDDISPEPVLKYLDEQGNQISSVSAEYGSNLIFSIELNERCNNSGITVGLYKGEELFETLHMVSGHYKITNVTENYTVQVSGCNINTYFVNFSKNDYVDYIFVKDGEDTEMQDNVVVSYGNSCYFKIKEKEGYQMGESTVVQATSASGQKITLEKNSLGQYKLTNIKDNYTITVENINEIFYRLKFIPIDGVTYYNEVGSVITGDFKVSYGKNFEFSIKIDDAHSESIQGAYIVTNESSQSEIKVQKLASDRYLIQNITQDITVRVAGVSKNKYTVTLTKDEGIDYYNKDGKVITGENEVEYGGSLNFKVNLYPLYANSNIKVMLGNQELSADDNEFYTVETVTENKTVTVVGIGKTDVAEVIETINSLPTDIKDDTDLEQIIQAVRNYNNLSDAEKSSVGNYYVLEQLQKKVADIIHTYNGVTAEGLDWNIKLIANPIDTDLDACTRIYGKLSSEYILSLYDVYLWDTLTERRYTLPEGKSIVLHLPTPNMTYFENPSGIHENSDGKLNFLTLNIGNSVTSLETSSLSPIGIVADRSIQPGRSSLIDAVDSNVSMLTNYTLGSLSGSGNKKESNYSGNKNNSSNSFDEGEALTGGSNSTANKFRKTDNSTTRLGSALKLILIIMILLILIAAIWAIVKKYRDKSKKAKNNDE